MFDQGTITMDGELVINRKNTEVRMMCKQRAIHCGHWCPHFCEPVYEGGARLDICEEKVLYFKELDDER